MNTDPGALCNIEYPFKLIFKPNLVKSRLPITYYSSTTVVFCKEFQNNWTIKMSLMDERDFVRFEFKISFERIFCMGLLPDTHNYGLRMRREYREGFPRPRPQRKPLVNDPAMHHGTCVTHVP